MLSEYAATRVRRALKRAANRRGLLVGRSSHQQLVERSFYLPLPDLDALPENVWHRPRPVPGIDIDVSSQVRWARDELADFALELDGPGDGQDTFEMHNQSYSIGDAHLTYAIVRYLKPRRIIELGSGQSTLVIARAVRANQLSGTEAEFRSYDPFPQVETVPETLPGLASLEPVPAQALPVELFCELNADDVLFVDTTHTVQIGGEVDHIILRVLPALAPGVWVHFHDIWLPHEYHRALFEHHGFVWAEQYLLEAFLAFNPTYEVKLASQAIARADPDGLRAVVPTYDGSTFPTSFWIRRTEA